MPREFCAECGAVTNMALTVSRRTVEAADGTARELVTTTLHCEQCGAFVRSEESPVVDPEEE